MSTNSADPDRLIGFAHSLAGPTAAATAALDQVNRALAHYNTTCPDVPFHTAAPASSRVALDRVHDVGTATRRVASAFAMADSSPGFGVRHAGDAEFARALGSVIARTGHMDFDAGVLADHDGSWEVGSDGLTGSLVGSILLGARVTGSKDFRVGPVETHHEIEAAVGVEVEGEASVHVGLDGVSARAHAGAFAGAKIEQTNEVTLGACTATVGLKGTAGAGAEAEGEARFGRDGIGLKGSLLASWGLGGGAEAEVTCRPPDLSGATRWAGDRVEDVREVVDDIEEVGTRAWDWSGDRLEDIGDWFDD